MDPKSAETHYHLGRAYYENGDYQPAVEHLTKTTELDSGFVKAWHNLGLALEALNQPDSARNCFLKAIELNEAASGRSEWPYLDYAGFLNRRGESQQALGLLKKAQTLNEKSDQVQFEIAKAHRNLEQWEQAVSALQAAIELNSRNPDYHYVLSLICKKLGRTEQARQALLEFERLKRGNAAP